MYDGKSRSKPRLCVHALTPFRIANLICISEFVSHELLNLA